VVKKIKNQISKIKNSGYKAKLKRIIIREEYCMGCRLCEVYCLVQHSRTKNIIKAYKGEYPKPQPRLIVEEKGQISFALQCRHCKDAPCLEACITGAMYRDEKTGAILCEENKCVGCWMCIMVCPLGVIDRNREGKKVISKCDLCIGEEIPVCVKNCPNEAIVYEEKK
jgi:carbon-monoxide dehydrogenase iron sulfur subunit